MTAIDKDLIEGRDKLFDDLIKIKSSKWNVKRVKIVELRKKLLVAQKFKCVYCRRPIVLDEVGHRDIDHILPKSQNPEKDFDPSLAKINHYDYRRHTGGYEGFMYSPMNLALSCKICNATKGSFDPLLNRVTPPALLPSGKDLYRWVHPYFDKYDDHIRVLEGFVYQAITQHQGQYVISACGLDTLNGLSARILDAMMLASKDMSDAMLDVAICRQNIDFKLAAERVYDHFRKLNPVTIEGFLRQLRAAACLDDKIKTLTDLRVALGTGNLIAAVA